MKKVLNCKYSSIILLVVGSILYFPLPFFRIRLPIPYWGLIEGTIGILLFLFGIVVLTYQLKNKIFKIEKEYLGAKIISFCFPIIGLIIYAVNIGKNNTFANGCVKWAIIAAIVYSIVGSLIFLV